jgi:hypothetical protein
VGKLNAPIVIHLISRNRFFTIAKYLVTLLSASSRINDKCAKAWKKAELFEPMTRGYVPWPVHGHDQKSFLMRLLPSFPTFLLALSSLLSRKTVILILFLGVMSLPLMAGGTPGSTAGPAGNSGDFVHYLADHQDDLGPFVSDNAGDIFRLGVPVLMGMMVWVVLCTMLVGWGIDVLMSRGFSFFYAPAYADVKRSLIYATGRLFLSFVYTGILSLAIIFSLKFPYAGIVMAIVVVILAGVRVAAQIVWILYLYRTPFLTSILFLLVIVIVHSIVGLFVARSVIGLRASSTITQFVDQEITPRMRADTATVRQQAASAQATRDATKSKVTELQEQIAQAQTDQEQLREEIEAKKSSDIYVFSQIVQMRARGDLESARDQLTAFLNNFPTSSLNDQVHTQLTQINNEIVAETEQKKQASADAARSAAQARADLLARAGKGEVTLSEMRHALIGKTRAQVRGLLGLPAQTSSDQWGYPQRMIVNPMTNEKTGLTVYFLEGTVQGVDYNRNGSPQ